MNDFPDLTCKQVAKLVEAIDGDGHMIFFPHWLSEKSGVTEEDLARWTHEHESDPNDHKETIYGPGGEVLDTLVGVYGLDVVGEVARLVGVGAFQEGRGSRCRTLTAKILAKLADCPDEEPFVEYAKRVMSHETD